jgi:hypothetical protein
VVSLKSQHLDSGPRLAILVAWQRNALAIREQMARREMLLQASLSFDRTRRIVLGRIEKIDDDEVQKDGLSRDELGAQ